MTEKVQDKASGVVIGAGAVAVALAVFMTVIGRVGSFLYLVLTWALVTGWALSKRPKLDKITALVVLAVIGGLTAVAAAAA
ncbi:hypothetical protein [Streptomyces sp. NPDC000994]